MEKKLLKIKDINYYLPNSKLTILKNIALDVDEGDFIIIIGHNGSGKSTLLNAVNRSIDYSSGDITLESKSVRLYSSAEFFKKVVTITQKLEENLFESFTVFENFLMYLGKEHLKAEILFNKTLELYNKNIILKKHTLVRDLSGGEKQCLALALAFINPPKLLLLDEHTSALDPKISDEVMELTSVIIKKHKITSIMVTHNLEYAVKYGNKIYALQDGSTCYYSNKNKGVSKQDLLKYCF